MSLERVTREIKKRKEDYRRSEHRKKERERGTNLRMVGLL
jgi:hypothetical protein